jgi:serine/threonine-protein kinase
MITPGGTVKVLDFGLAKSGDAEPVVTDLSRSPTLVVGAGETSLGTILGTAAYMSPEQARGAGVDRRTDVWSFGCILFESLTGRAAFQGAASADLIAAILEREPDLKALPSGTPPRLRELLRRCLRKDAGERPRDIRDVRLELADLARGGATPAASADKSIAVLPFSHAGGSEDEYFADGVTEEILNALAQLEGLRVAARTSSFAFKGRQQDLREIGEKLSVSTVLEGSVRRAGNRLRITAQLVNAADGYQLWSERYDREMTDVFAVQDEIARAIASKLTVTLGGDAERTATRRGTSSLEAYESYLKGRALQLKRGPAILEAIPYFERAIALDPGYADALGMLADSYRLMGTMGQGRPGEVMPRATTYATRALEIDPDSVEAISTLADVQMQYDRDYARALRGFQRALDIDPRHTRTRCERSMWGLACGGLSADESVAEVLRAVADDPLNAWAMTLGSMVLGNTGRFDEAVALADRAVETDPGSFVARWQTICTRSWGGRYDEAIALGPDALARTGRHGWILGGLAHAYWGRGDRTITRAIYDELEARSRMEYVATGRLAQVAAAARLSDVARTLAGRAVEERDPIMVLIRVAREFEPLWGEPWFPELVSKMGFLDGG